jgi:hypothetical protein
VHTLTTENYKHRSEKPHKKLQEKHAMHQQLWHDAMDRRQKAVQSMVASPGRTSLQEIVAWSIYTQYHRQLPETRETLFTVR